MLKITKIVTLLGCGVVLFACGKFDDYKSVGFSEKKAANFLIGKCIVTAGELSVDLIDYACDAAKAGQYPGPLNAVPYVLYKEKTIQVNVIVGLNVKNNPNIPPGLQPSDITVELPIEYSINGLNKVATKVIDKNGCITNDEFELKGADIYSKPLPSAGDCSPAQISATNFKIKQGEEKMFFKSMIN